MKRILYPSFLAFVLVLSLQACAQETDLHASYHALLNTHTDANGQVDYEGLKPHAPALKAYLNRLADTNVEGMPTKEEQMLFYVNLYNAATIDLILDNYPTTSIMGLDSGKTWDVKRVRLGKKLLSLNEIEHEILRKRWDDPRIHVAVNCAAASCPALFLAESEEQLNEMLDESMRAFVNDTTKNTIASDTLFLSKIFEWYADDFGDIKTYLKTYVVDPELIDDQTVVRFRPYDWSLNEKLELD